MKQYLDLLSEVRDHGNRRQDRTGTGTLSIFGPQLRFDLTKGFPLVTTKKIHFKSVVAELLWMLSGGTNVTSLEEQDVTIWSDWSDEYGNLGPIYGHQFRHWESPCRIDPDGNLVLNESIDQIATLITGIRERPHSRRHIVSAWNVADLPNETLSPQENVAQGKMSLSPCHLLYQAYVCDGCLSLKVYQRSADLFLGLPFNIASYALLTHLIADQCGLTPAELIWTAGDAHIYLNHLEQVDEQLSRSPMVLPELAIRGPVDSIFSYGPEHIELVGYEYHPAIKGEVSV